MNNIKPLKSLALSSLLLFLGILTLTPEPIRLSKALWNIEAYSMVSALSSLQWPDKASILMVESAFAFAPMLAPKQGFVVDIVRDNYSDKTVLEGQFHTPQEDDPNFRFYPEQPGSSFALRLKHYQDYEHLYSGTNKTHYAEYSIASLAFPGEWQEVLLANGSVYWTCVENKVVAGWAVVGDEPPLFIKMDEIKDKAFKDTIPWADVKMDINSAYYGVLKSYRHQELTLPVVGAKIPWPIAGIALVITALYLSMLFLHFMFRLRSQGVEREEPWLLVEPCQPAGMLERLLFRSMTVIGGVALAVFMLLPVVIIYLVKSTFPYWVFLMFISTSALL